MSDTMQKVKLGDICEKVSSNIAQKDLENNSGNYPIYGAAGLIKTVDFYQQSREYLAIVKDGAGVGRVMKLPANSSIISTMQGIMPKANADINYLYYLLTYLDLAKFWSGSTIPHIYFKDYKNEEINLPQLKEQKVIAEKLDKVTDLIEKRKKQIEKLDELVKSRFIEMFGDPFVNSRWDIIKLSEISLSIFDGSNIEKKYYSQNEEVIFLRIQNVWCNEFRLEDSVFISQEINSLYADTSLFNGDILITKIGRYYTKDSSLGRVAIYLGENNKANYSNNIMRIRLNKEANSRYINTLLNLPEYQKYIKKVSIGGTDKRALSKNIIANFPIIVPPIELQNKFAEFVEKVEKSKSAIKKSLSSFETLKKSLMQKYFG